MSKKFKIASILIASFLVVVLCYLFVFDKVEVSTSIPDEIGDLSFPDSISVGSKLIHEVEFDASECHLLLTTSWGNYISEPTLENEKWRFVLEDSLTQTAGIYILDLACKGKLMKSKKMYVISGLPAEPLEAFIGSKSIEADNGVHWAMISAIPADTFNNLTADKTPVNFSLYRPDETFSSFEKEAKHGVAYHKIYSKSKVGKTIIGVTAGAATAKEKELSEMPGFPVNFKIYSERVYSYADKRQNFRLKTSVIKDRYGNIVADGTLLNIDVTDSDQSKRILTSYTMDGVAELDIQNPPLAGKISVNASIYGDAKSNSIELSFKKYLKKLPVRFSAEQKAVIVGPLIGPLKQYMSDGAEIEMYMEGLDQIKIGVVKNGYATIDLSKLKAGIYKGLVSSGGLETKVDIKLETNE
ncbi:hypothetical protein [Arcticibacterium luteifluviistationis]|uniref:Uncharacterized protein n=1 Tax=Arcticibacterium luteifluviistationis TaxID=1784714 RepID=A0A2Z4GDK7_9BACT|nr:hypothetical protein [Arcticibacterium luteifluviistationis]AWV99105.1 hypothetical protein DJ013_13380 [Arcticibacterium luteifluviistationis]